ncbi:MAG: hypothetical protein ABNH00_09810 [Dokdonia sp.]|jgi:hypothetical protein|nr:hypothetical protein [Cytophagaceae bacterium]|tara:strand:+ start:1157 stop:1864 length:708 start_codon:yes stop_codon:yes gene_type:complete
MKFLLRLLPIILLCFSCEQQPKTSSETSEPTPEIATSSKDRELTIAETIAYKHGLENWKDITQLDFTFNVDRAGRTVAKRSWSWKPKLDQVTLHKPNDTITYNRKQLDSTVVQADQAFINDKFWLLAPYQLVWDEGTTITTQDTATAPISKQKTKMLTIVYGDQGGYTPGDAYDFYYDDDFMIKEWVYRKGNQEEPSMMTTFEAYTETQGLKIPLVHYGPDNDLKLYFTDVRAQR